MRGPQPPAVTLTAEERRELAAIVRRPSAPQQLALRARIILLAADGANNSQIARHLAVDVGTPRLWRTRWLGLAAVPLEELSVAERLEDAPRPGGPCRITAAQVCQLTALACETPQGSGRPISQWSGRELADEVVRRGIVDTISARHATRLLKRGRCNPTASATG
ncbi:MAG: helix-turn-helix domain-containing protein [Chloroflexota bacterium]|nr:helix-turn-helix domain-containing protein [Chloroflexota bacterium]